MIRSLSLHYEDTFHRLRTTLGHAHTVRDTHTLYPRLVRLKEGVGSYIGRLTSLLIASNTCDLYTPLGFQIDAVRLETVSEQAL